MLRQYYSRLLSFSRPSWKQSDPAVFQFSSESKALEKDATTKAHRRLRNIGIVAHINAGKTTTTERILYHAGSTDTVGDVDKGNTVTDYLVQERDRGITITSATVSYNWKKHRVNLIDTPGHVDFTIEVERSLSVLDAAVIILDASAGVEAQTITVWNQAAKYQLPNIIFLNKYDKPQADYKMCMKDLKNDLNIEASLIQLPVRAKSSPFANSIINIVDRKCIHWSKPNQDHGSEYTVQSLPEADILNDEDKKRYIHSVEEQREKLINYLTDFDEEFANHVLECDRLSDVSSLFLLQAIRRATLNCALSPVLIGSSFKYIGVQQLMDSIIDFLPSPEDREKQITKNLKLSSLTKSNHTCGFIFKTMHDKRLGPLTYLKVCSGKIGKMQRVLNLESGKQELIKKVYRVFADELKELDEPVERDDIVVVTGLVEAKTGDILVDTSFPYDFPSSVSDTSGELLPFHSFDQHIHIPKLNQMEPVYFCTIESRNSSQQIKLESALACLAREDPSFTYEINQLGITTIRGMGKLHLEVIRDRIESEYGLNPLLGPLQISYRETIGGYATEELSVTRLINSAKNTLFIKLYVRSKPNAGFFTSKQLRLDASSESTLGHLRNDHRKAIEQGFISALNHGPLMGFPVIDCDILLLDFKANNRCGLPLISSVASQCLTSALQRCELSLMEPIMLLEVVMPTEYNGTILSDLTSVRRGVVLNTVARNNNSIVVRSHTPLSTLSDYSEFLRIATSGRGSFSMELYNYSAMSEADKANIVRL